MATTNTHQYLKNRMKYYCSKQLCNINVTRKSEFLSYLRLRKLKFKTCENSSFFASLHGTVQTHMPFCLSAYTVSNYKSIRVYVKYLYAHVVLIASVPATTLSRQRHIRSWCLHSSNKKRDLLLSRCEIQNSAQSPIPIS